MFFRLQWANPSFLRYIKIQQLGQSWVENEKKVRKRTYLIEVASVILTPKKYNVYDRPEETIYSIRDHIIFQTILVKRVLFF